MIRFINIVTTVFALMLFLSVSCSKQTPVTPSDAISIDNISNPPVLVSERDSSGNPVGGVGLLGLFSLNLETDPLSVSLNPVRTTDMRDSIEALDLTNYLSLVPCKDCIRIASIGIDGMDRINMSIGIRHPFAPGDPGLPISGRNRIDLHVFNIEGVIALVGGGASETKEFADSNITVAKDRLVNASGYTSYLDEYLDFIMPTPSNAHPYILHFRDYSSGNYMPGFDPTGFLNVFDASGYLVMAMGSDYNYRDYVLDVQIGRRYDFLFAVQCTYGISTETFLDRFEPVYRLPQFNKKAASEVFVTVKDNSLIDGSTTSSATVQVKVLDMNHGVEAGAALNRMSHDSSVKQITIEVPDMINDPLIDDTPAETGGDPRNPADPLTYEYSISNEKGIAAGTYLGLVAVEDNFPTGTNTHSFLHGRDGGIRVPPDQSPLTGLIDIDKFVTYQVFEYEVMQSMQFELVGIMPNPRSYCKAVVVDDIIYVIGGTIGIFPTDPRSNRIDAYDPVTNTWDTSLDSMPTSRSGMAVAAVNHEIYVIGGQLVSGSGNTNVVEVFDTIDSTWSTFPTGLPGPTRHGMQAVSKDNVIYVAGGYNTVEKEQNSMYRLDTVLQSWGAEPDMIGKRTQFAMTIKGNYIYVVGGDPVVGPGSLLTSYVEIYDTVNREWSYPNSNASVQDFAPEPYIGILGSDWAVVDGSIILVGGAFDLDLLNKTVYAFSDSTDEFTEIGECEIPRILFGRAVWQNRIYMFGGIALSDTDPPVPFLTPSFEFGEM